MDRIKEKALLFDIYGNLLTEHQRKIYSDVVENDFSLSEIGEEIGISRQGVHDAVKRIDKILAEYEEKLHFADNYLKNTELLTAIEAEIERMSSEGIDCGNLKKLFDELFENI